MTNSPTPGAAIARSAVAASQPSASPKMKPPTVSPGSQPPAAQPVPVPPSNSPQKPGAPSQSEVTAALQSLDMDKIQKLVAKIQSLEADLRPKEETARNLEASGKVEEARLYRQLNILPIRTNTEKLKGIVRTVMAAKTAEKEKEKAGKSQTVSAGAVDGSSAPQPPPPSGGAGSNIAISSTAPSSGQTNVPADTPNPMNARPPSQPQPPVPPQGSVLPSNAPPQVAAQMRKLIEQQNRTPRMPTAAPVPPTNVNMPPTPLQTGMIRPNIWRGALTWKGFDATSHVRREMQAMVQVQFKIIPDGL